MADEPVKTLDLADLRAAHQIIYDYFADDPEPVPSWDEGDIGLLETCAECTEAGAYGTQKYPDLLSKTARSSTQA